MSNEQETETVLTADTSGADGTAAEALEAGYFPMSDHRPGNGEAAEQADTADTPDNQGQGDGGDGEKAPTEYAEFDIPEGITVQDTDVVAFKGLAQDMGLSQQNAQKLLSFEAERIRTMNDQLSEQHVQQTQEWAEQARADREFGGDAFNQNVATAVAAIDTFGTPEVKELLNQTGLGSHPGIIRMFWKVGKAISPDGAIAGGNGGVSAQPNSRSMFPNSNHN